MKQAALLTPQRELVLATILHAPGMGTRPLARLLGMNESTLEYHARCLEKAGAIVREREGRVLAHYAQGNVTLARKRRRAWIASSVAEALRAALPQAARVEALEDLVLVRLASGERFVLANDEAAAREVRA